MKDARLSRDTGTETPITARVCDGCPYLDWNGKSGNGYRCRCTAISGWENWWMMKEQLESQDAPENCVRLEQHECVMRLRQL